MSLDDPFMVTCLIKPHNLRHRGSSQLCRTQSCKGDHPSLVCVSALENQPGCRLGYERAFTQVSVLRLPLSLLCPFILPPGASCNIILSVLLRVFEWLCKLLPVYKTGEENYAVILLFCYSNIDYQNTRKKKMNYYVFIHL